MSDFLSQTNFPKTEAVRPYREAQDYWGAYYFDDEQNRSALDPDGHIVERLQRDYPNIHPLEAVWIGRVARESTIDMNQL